MSIKNIRNALLIAGSALVLAACGKGPNPGLELTCQLDGLTTFQFATAGDQAISSYSLFIAYPDQDGNAVGYSGAEFSVVSTVDAFLPCLGDGCVPGVATRQLDSKTNDGGLALFDAIITGSNIDVNIPILVYGNSIPTGCEIPLSISIQ